MDIQVKTVARRQAKYIRVCIPVRYDEEDIPNSFPFRSGDVWDVTYDLDEKKIVGWPTDFGGYDVHMKVVDTGSYYLLDADKNVIAKSEQDYVPNMVPGSYGDYVEMKIQPDGSVLNWHASRVELEEFANRDFED